ncbi:hypothetical protein F5Y13DRAFT_161427 [Hypoxylon sp. FL1857]|nr:hypothetical protein F5Y13DRAFT_161427 [Hypoxylon sp. FL1857]
MRSFVAVLAAAASFQGGSAAPFANDHSSHSLSHTRYPQPTGGHHHHPTGTGGFPHHPIPTGGFPHPPTGHHHSGGAHPTGWHHPHNGEHNSHSGVSEDPTGSPGRFPHTFGQKHRQPWGYTSSGFAQPSGGEHHHHPHPTGTEHHHHPHPTGGHPHPTGHHPSHFPGHKVESSDTAEPTAVEKRSGEHPHPPFSWGGAHPTGYPHHHPSGGFPHHHPSGGYPHPTGGAGWHHHSSPGHKGGHHSSATTTSTASAAQPTAEAGNQNEKRFQGPGPVIWPRPSGGFPTSFHIPTFHPFPTGGFHPHPTGEHHHHSSSSHLPRPTSQPTEPTDISQAQRARAVLQEMPRVVQEAN